MRISHYIFSGMKESASTRRLLRFAQKNIINFIEESEKVSLQKDNGGLLLKTVIETVKPTCSYCTAYFLESRDWSSSFCSSDVDLFLDCENNYQNIDLTEACQKNINSIKISFM